MMESNKLSEICSHFEIDTKIRALAEFGLSYLNCAITAVAFRIFVFVFNNLLKHLQYGGPDGELGAALRYLSQRFAQTDKRAIATLTDIGVSVQE